MKSFFIGVFFSIIFLFYFYNDALSIEDVNLFIQNKANKIEVNVQIIPSESFISEFKEGLNKNIMILIDLYRKWSIIPNEFVWGVQIKREFISNPIKEEFIIKSYDVNIIKEKRFKSWQDAIEWGMKIDSIIIDTKDLEKGKYYVKVTVESNIKKLPSIFEHLLFFIPKHEKKISKESEILRLP